MSLAELMPLVKGLSQSDRQELMSFLAAQELAEQKQIFSADIYPVWSPYDSFEAADLLMQMVKDDSHSERLSDKPEAFPTPTRGV
jgi:hypothetical protein